MDLRTARLRKKLTQEQLADLVGVDQATISNIENGKVTPSWPTLYRIARVFNCKPESLIAVSDVSSPEARS